MLRAILRSSVAVLLIAGAASLIYFGAALGYRSEMGSSAQSDVQSHLDGPMADQEMQSRLEIHTQRIVLKDRAVRDLLAGRLTLIQAAARFRDVEQEYPLTWWPRIAATDPSDGDRLCRIVIERAAGWVQSHLPSQAAAVAARLVAELEEERDRDGVVRLPE